MLASAFVVGGMLQQATAQSSSLALDELSSFENPGKSWQLVGDVIVDLEKENKLEASPGTGILLNLPGKRTPGTDLYTQLEHGDIDLELDYMMARGANSGIFLQGRYELQLHDSWNEQNLTAAHNGGVYERWDENRPRGQEGYQGQAARQQVSRAPGLWQHLKISFQAPRFDAKGNKTENARLLLVELNGVRIHENVELSGPTRGAVSKEEQAMAPLRLQGDHGAVAFRNIVLTRYEKPRPELKNLQYTLYKGKFQQEAPYDSLSPVAEGRSAVLTTELGSLPSQFLIRYTGTLQVPEAGAYTFKLRNGGGAALIRISGQELIPMQEWYGEGSLNLPAGEVPFELVFTKYKDWMDAGLGLHISGEGVREFLISDKEVNMGEITDPILVDATEKPILRSFMDLPNGPRVTHALSVGSKEQLHYTYDLDHGAIVQLWRGGFLDATPMWHERGDGSSRPLGSVQHFTSQPTLSIARLASGQAPWASDTSGSSFRPKGYSLAKVDQPRFRYEVYGADVEDAIRVLENGKGLEREVSVQQAGDKLYMRLASASRISEVSRGLYLIGDKAYYLRLDDAGGAKPLVRKSAERQELIIPLAQKLRYSILF